MKLETKYNYLLNPYTTPKIVREALKLYGTKEVKGTGNNPEILSWAKEIKPYVGIDYDMDSTPWCGLFMGVVTHRAGFKPPKICVRAKEWLNFGWLSTRPEVGNIMVFDRKGGGHVGLYVGEDQDCYHIHGGNQGNSVSIARIQKQRLVGARECPWKWLKPLGARPVFLDNDGVISNNEA